MLASLIPHYILYIEILIYLAAILMHTASRNSSIITLYIFQSAMVTLLLFTSSFAELSASLVLVTVTVLAVKLIIAPRFFFRFVRAHDVKFVGDSYLNIPLTLVAVAAITFFIRSGIFEPLLALVPGSGGLLFFPLSTMFISLFLIINHKAALSQMIGILSLENAIVSFAALAGLEQTPALQIGVIFDVCVWVVIASVFISMLFTHFGTLDVSAMKRLQD